jgi:hypothetical protein
MARKAADASQQMPPARKSRNQHGTILQQAAGSISGHLYTHRGACVPTSHQLSTRAALLTRCSCPPPPPHPAGIYPLQNTFIRKVKILKSPKFDLVKLMEVHGDYTEEVPAKIERPAEAPAAEVAAE